LNLSHEHLLTNLCRLKDKNDPNLNRWEKKLVHEDNGALYTWEGLTTPYQKPQHVKSYPPIEISGQDWKMGHL
jgi:hypothetical protein